MGDDNSQKYHMLLLHDIVTCPGFDFLPYKLEKEEEKIQCKRR